MPWGRFARVRLRHSTPLTSREPSERFQFGPVSKGTVGTAQSDAITAAAISAVAARSEATSRVNDGGAGGSPERRSLQTRRRSAPVGKGSPGPCAFWLAVIMLLTAFYRGDCQP